jgi:hypothetical protein
MYYQRFSEGMDKYFLPVPEDEEEEEEEERWEKMFQQCGVEVPLFEFKMSNIE